MKKKSLEYFVKQSEPESIIKFKKIHMYKIFKPKGYVDYDSLAVTYVSFIVKIKRNFSVTRKKVERKKEVSLIIPCLEFLCPHL